MSVQILTGDCREVPAGLPADSVHCVVTSPPYWGLRSYIADGDPLKELEIGLEETIEAYIDKMVAVFREVRRVLRPDGVAWINMGDSYANDGKWGGATGGKHCEYLHGGETRVGREKRRTGLKPKDLCGVPWRLALALQQPYYTGRIRRVEDRIWLAAMIDAEGCMFIHRRKAGTSAYSKYKKTDGTEVSYSRTQDTYGVGLEVANTSEAVVRRCMEIVGKGSICSQSPNQNDRRRQTILRWNMRTNECRDIIREVYPHLVAKQHQARLILGCPSSGDRAAAAHQALIGLHRGKPTDVDFSAPESMFEKGWYLRQDCIWSKANPMPESITDRCTKAHEYLFLLSKSERYFYDADAIKEPAAAENEHDLTGSGMFAPGQTQQKGNRRKIKMPDGWDTGAGGHGSFHRQGREKGKTRPAELARGFRGGSYVGGEPGPRTETGNTYAPEGFKRNKRSVWTVATAPFSEAHFATFPPDLIEPCILAGTSEKGCCAKCGAPWVRDVGSGNGKLVGQRETVGWRPTCGCEALIVPCTVLDPFGGAGTTGLVADRLQRNAVLIELNPAYAAMAERRIKGDAGMFAQIAAE